MTYNAVTIDTETVTANGVRLDHGLIAQLEQFRGGSVRVVLSEVTAQEIQNKLAEKAKTTRDDLKKLIHDSTRYGQLTCEQKQPLERLLEDLGDAEEHARRQLSEFIARTGAEIIPVSYAPTKRVVDAYFQATPPFSGKKKHEFPDAFTLLSLEAWAEEQDCKILCVSKDRDWAAFAPQSDRLDVVEDLDKAIAALIEKDKRAAEKAWELLADLQRKDSSSSRIFQDCLQDELTNIIPDFNYDCSHSWEEEEALIEFSDYEIDALRDDILIVRSEEDTFAFSIPINISALATVTVNLSVYDSIDKDLVPISSQTHQKEIEFEIDVLIQCYYIEEELPEIFSVQFIDQLPHIDFGYIALSFSEDS